MYKKARNKSLFELYWRTFKVNNSRITFTFINLSCTSSDKLMFSVYYY